MIKMAVVGAASMVGSRFCETIKDFDLVKSDLTGKISVDITNKNSIEDFFKNHQFDWVILFSAFTDVDAAEKQRNDKTGLCWKINVDGTKNVAQACKNYGRKLIFISTDFVFDGTRGAYTEDDPPGPNFDKISWYGITKAEAEKVIKNTLSDYIILRIAYPYRSKFEGKDDLVKRVWRLYKEGELYPMFTDQIITPTFIDDIAPAVSLLISKGVKGTVNLASPKPVSQYDFAKELIATFGGNPNDIKKGSIIEFLKQKGKTPRSKNSNLNVEKIKELGFNPTDWKEGIKTIYQESKGNLI